MKNLGRTLQIAITAHIGCSSNSFSVKHCSASSVCATLKAVGLDFRVRSPALYDVGGTKPDAANRMLGHEAEAIIQQDGNGKGLMRYIIHAKPHEVHCQCRVRTSL